MLAAAPTLDLIPRQRWDKLYKLLVIFLLIEINLTAGTKHCSVISRHLTKCTTTLVRRLTTLDLMLIDNHLSLLKILALSLHS